VGGLDVGAEVGGAAAHLDGGGRAVARLGGRGEARARAHADGGRGLQCGGRGDGTTGASTHQRHTASLAHTLQQVQVTINSL
jgi:hypothetical protein